jgi:hypothetical protein
MFSWALKFLKKLYTSSTIVVKKYKKKNKVKWSTFEPIGNDFQKVVPFQKVIA